MEAGFLDCKPIRDLAENQGKEFLTRPLAPGDEVVIPDLVMAVLDKAAEVLHEFVKKSAPPVFIRFVHGSRTKPYRLDDTLTFLNVSNFVTDRAGRTETAAWVGDGHRAFDANADADVDSFKVEVVDPRTSSADLPVELDVLQPTFGPTGDITGHTEFPGDRATAGTQRNRRSLDATASKQKSTRCFRTCYLRLVVDDEDKAARPTQTLLVSDDVRAGGDDRIEILDQQVRATYILTDCPASAASRCRVTATVPVGDDAEQRRLRIALHVLRSAPGGAPVVPMADVRSRVRKWVRRYYAQANVAPSIITEAEVDPPDDMLVVSERQGNLAAGDESMSFRLRATRADGTVIAAEIRNPITPGGASAADPPYRPAAGDRPTDTADALADRIRAAGFTATVTRNVQLVPNIGRPADIVIHDPGGGGVAIEALVSTGTRQLLSSVSVNPAAIVQTDGLDFNTGSSDHRCLMRNFDTGDDRLDMFIIGNHAGGRTGQGIMPLTYVPAAKRPETVLRRNCFCIAAAADATDTFPMLAAHEGGHAVMDVDHTADGTQLMMGRAGPEPVTNTTGGPKRLADRPIVHDGAGMVADIHVNLVQRLRTHSGGAVVPW